VSNFLIGNAAARALDAFLPESEGRDVVVPPDLHLAKLPPVAADGTAECSRCKQQFPFARLHIAGDAYACGGCLLRQAQVAAAQQGDLANIKLARGRWWLVPALVLGVIAIVALGLLI
jgi:hypothetical protein